MKIDSNLFSLGIPEILFQFIFVTISQLEIRFNCGHNCKAKQRYVQFQEIPNLRHFLTIASVDSIMGKYLILFFTDKYKIK